MMKLWRHDKGLIIFILLVYIINEWGNKRKTQAGILQTETKSLFPFFYRKKQRRVNQSTGIAVKIKRSLNTRQKITNF